MSDPWLMDPAFAPSAEVSSTHDAALAAYQRETEGVPVLDGPHWCREHGRMELPGGHEPDPEDADLIDLRDAASDWFGKDEAAALITKVVAAAERRGAHAERLRCAALVAAQVEDSGDRCEMALRHILRPDADYDAEAMGGKTLAEMERELG